MRFSVWALVLTALAFGESGAAQTQNEIEKQNRDYAGYFSKLRAFCKEEVVKAQVTGAEEELRYQQCYKRKRAEAAPGRPPNLVTDTAALGKGIERSAASLECSQQADAQGLHGAERAAFRSQCKANADRLPQQIAQQVEKPTALISTQKCSTKYQAAKAAGTLAGRQWIEFRSTECRLVSGPKLSIRLPNGISPMYAQEPEGKARMHTCVDQYNANKATNESGGLRWIEETGGGYYSVCNEYLKTANTGAPPRRDPGQGVQGRLGLSFDCATVKNASARLICSDQDLTNATQQLGFVYAKAKDHGGDPDGTTKAQLAWIKERNTRCGLDNKSNVPVEELAFAKPCMLEAINTRIAEFGDSVGAGVAGATLKTQSVEAPQTLSQTEIDAFRKFMASWAPPAGSPAIDVHFRLKRDGTIDGTPEVISTGAGSTFEVAKNEAVRTVLQAQPFKMFRPESYDAWKDMVVTFEAPAVPIAEEARDRQPACVAKYDSAKTAGEVGDISRENFLKVCALTGTPVIPGAKK